MKTKLIRIAAIITASSIPYVSMAADWSIAGLESFGSTSNSAVSINNSGQVLVTYLWPVHSAYTIPEHPECYPCSYLTGDNGIGIVSTFEKAYGGTGVTPYSINDSGQITGITYVPDLSFIEKTRPVGFITGPGGIGKTDIVAPDAGAPIYALAVNNSGQVTGFFGADKSADFAAKGISFYQSNHAFITGPNGLGFTDLGTLGGTSSYATDINSTGQVVGSFVKDFVKDTEWHTFYTGPDGIGLHDLGISGGIGSIVINDSGDIVMNYFISGKSHAYYIDHTNHVPVNFSALGGDYVSVSDINNDGQIIGIESKYNISDAFLYTHGVMVNLSHLDVVTDNGWTNINPSAINDHGQIVGSGRHNGVVQPFFLTITDDKAFFDNYVTVPLPAVPEPQTYALLLAGLGLMGFVGRRLRLS